MKRHFISNTDFATFAGRTDSVSRKVMPGLLSRFCFWTSFVIGLILCQLPEQARAQDPARAGTDQWSGIQRLQVNLASQETAPFIAWNAPALPSSEREVSTKRKNTAASPPRSLSEPDNLPSRQEAAAGTSLADHRHQLRDTLARDGQSSLEGRDSLTREALSVVKWTIVTLVLGCVAVVGLKKVSFQKAAESSSHRIRVLETLALGRQQGLKLVEVGGERFLIASDQGGIKNVTLLPSWPAMDQPEAEIPPVHSYSSSISPFEATLRTAAS